jgi:hypothetical protein
MKKLLILFLFLFSCGSLNSNNNKNNEILNFNQDLSFNEFKELLDKYSKITGYPNINE